MLSQLLSPPISSKSRVSFAFLFIAGLPLIASASQTPSLRELTNSLKKQRAAFNQAFVKVKEATSFQGREQQEAYQWAFKGDKLYKFGQRSFSAGKKVDYTEVYDGQTEQDISYPKHYPDLTSAQTMMGPPMSLARSLNPLAVTYQYNNEWYGSIFERSNVSLHSKTRVGKSEAVEVSFVYKVGTVTVTFIKRPAGWVGVTAVMQRTDHGHELTETQTVESWSAVEGGSAPKELSWTGTQDVAASKVFEKHLSFEYVPGQAVPDSLFAFKTLPPGAVEVNTITMQPYWVMPGGKRLLVDRNAKQIPEELRKYYGDAEVKTPKAAPEGLPVGSKAPDFSFKDSSGATVSLSGFRGRVVVLDFWATWCEPCTLALPHLEHVFESLKGQNVSVVAVSSGDTDASVASWLSRSDTKYGFQFALPSGQLANQPPSDLYQVHMIPATVVIEPDGTIAAWITGYQGAEDHRLEAELAKLGIGP